MLTRDVVITLFRPDGAPLPYAPIKAILRTQFSAADGTVPPAQVYGQTNVEGEQTLSLAVPESGTASYDIELPGGGGGRVAVSAGPPTTLQQLLVAGAVVAPSALQIAIDTEAAARIAADDALDTRINELVVNGGGDATYRHVQSAPVATWTVTHNLGKRVSVTVVDSAGDQVLGSVHYTNNNQVTIGFSAAFAGEAYCN